MKSSKIRPRSRRAAAAVEFAVVAPLFLLLLGGIIEFGQAFRIQHALSSAARRGARSAILAGATSSQVRQEIRDHCQRTMAIQPADLDVELMVNGSTGTALDQAEQGDEIQLTLRVPFSKAGTGFYTQLFSTATLSAACTLEHE